MNYYSLVLESEEVDREEFERDNFQVAKDRIWGQYEYYRKLYPNMKLKLFLTKTECIQNSEFE